MTNLHFGYEHDTEHALYALLGEQYWSSDLNISYAIPYADMPAENGTIQSRPVDRRAIIIEGDMKLIQELLGPDFEVRRQRIAKRLNRRTRR